MLKFLRVTEVADIYNAGAVQKVLQDEVFKRTVAALQKCPDGVSKKVYTDACEAILRTRMNKSSKTPFADTNMVLQASGRQPRARCKGRVAWQRCGAGNPVVRVDVDGAVCCLLVPGR